MSTLESWKWCLGTALAGCKDASQPALTTSGTLYTLDIPECESRIRALVGTGAASGTVRSATGRVV